MSKDSPATVSKKPYIILPTIDKHIVSREPLKRRNMKKLEKQISKTPIPCERGDTCNENNEDSFLSHTLEKQ
jgi:hypothetical protein